MSLYDAPSDLDYYEDRRGPDESDYPRSLNDLARRIRLAQERGQMRLARRLTELWWGLRDRRIQGR